MDAKFDTPTWWPSQTSCSGSAYPENPDVCTVPVDKPLVTALIAPGRDSHIALLPALCLSENEQFSELPPCDVTRNKWRPVGRGVRRTRDATDWTEPVTSQLSSTHIRHHTTAGSVMMNRDVRLCLKLGQIGAKWGKSGTF